MSATGRTPLRADRRNGRNSRRTASALRAFCLGLVAAMPAAAQTFEEAARANVALATSLCAQAMLRGQPPSATFGNAGFVYRGVDRGVNQHGIALGLDHYFDAPADTAKVEVMNPNGHPALCSVYTRHLPEPEMSGLVSAVLSRDFPATETRSATEWFVRGVSDLPLIVTLRTIGTNHRYEQPGTVQVTMSFPG